MSEAHDEAQEAICEAELLGVSTASVSPHRGMKRDLRGAQKGGDAPGPGVRGG